MLAGGRPPIALAKDCCYRDISTLAEDIQRMQRQKSELEANYEQAIKAQTHALDEVAQLTEQNAKLTKELNDIKDVALSVESEANVSLDALHKKCTVLKMKLNDSKKRIQDLESQIDSKGYTTGGSKDIKAANMQIKFLQEQLQSVKNKGKFEVKIGKFVKFYKRNFFLFQKSRMRIKNRSGKVSEEKCKIKGKTIG